MIIEASAVHVKLACPSRAAANGAAHVTSLT
jgi:hypothetical protein